jgi:hypothetical protein
MRPIARRPPSTPSSNSPRRSSSAPVRQPSWCETSLARPATGARAPSEATTAPWRTCASRQQRWSWRSPVPSGPVQFRTTRRVGCSSTLRPSWSTRPRCRSYAASFYRPSRRNNHGIHTRGLPSPRRRDDPAYDSRRWRRPSRTAEERDRTRKSLRLPRATQLLDPARGRARHTGGTESRIADLLPSNQRFILEMKQVDVREVSQVRDPRKHLPERVRDREGAAKPIPKAAAVGPAGPKVRHRSRKETK